MREERENRILYQRLFDEIHASGELKRKVEAVEKDYTEKRAAIKIRYAVALGAVLLLMFSNVIAYAATGRTWISTVILPDGQKREVLLEEHYDEDGSRYFTGRFQKDDPGR